jgi:membrane peptidoglycan carboxypeptidase
MKNCILTILILLSNVFLCTLYADTQDVEQLLKQAKITYSTAIYAEDGEYLGYIGNTYHIECKSLSEISPSVINALLATEDRDFLTHEGISVRGLVRATVNNLKGSREGGSTITMQLARTLYLSREKTIKRKLAEIDIAMRLESMLTKQEILLLYLNTMYLGHGTYGIWAASQEYFSKPPSQLTIPEACTIIGLLCAPSAYEPVAYPQKAFNRRNEILHNLKEVGKITSDEYSKYIKMPLNLHIRKPLGQCFIEHIRQTAGSQLKGYGKSFNDGLIIISTLQSQLQQAAEYTVKANWLKFPSSMKSAQIGLISVDTDTGKIVAMVGGNPQESPRGINHTTQIRRQPGSSFKPFVYASVLENGHHLKELIKNTPISVQDGSNTVWNPRNLKNHNNAGPTVTMRAAIKHSLNLPAIHAILKYTTPDSVVNLSYRCGIRSPLRAYPSLALGTSEVSPLEMASAYAVFANKGLYHTPSSIVKIIDSNGKVLFQATYPYHLALSQDVVFELTSALKDVVNGGTGYTVRNIYNGVAAGKTGTTENSTDAWFIGYNRKISTAIWVGYDGKYQKLPPGYDYGGVVCAPIWGGYMARAANYYPESQRLDFIQPDSLELGLPVKDNIQSQD